MGLTGFDSSFVVCTCNPNCSDSLNGAKNRIANEQFALVTSNGARGQFIAARQQKRWMTAGKNADDEKDHCHAGKTARGLSN
jgi:hypothetical protein